MKIIRLVYTAFTRRKLFIIMFILTIVSLIGLLITRNPNWILPNILVCVLGMIVAWQDSKEIK